jgi:hypothetical protein
VRQGDRRKTSFVGEVHRFEDRFGVVDEIAARIEGAKQGPSGDRAALYGEPHVLEDRQPREQVGELEGTAESPPRAG